MKAKATQVKYIAEILEFTKKQIKINTGLNVELSVTNYELPTGITPHIICEKVSEVTEIDMSLIRSIKKQQKYVVARMCIVYLVKSYFPEMKLREVGDLINKDHTTVINLKRNAEAGVGIHAPYFYPTFLTVEKAINELLTSTQNETKN